MSKFISVTGKIIFMNSRSKLVAESIRVNHVTVKLEISSLGNFAFKLEMETRIGNGLEDGKLSQST